MNMTLSHALERAKKRESGLVSTASNYTDDEADSDDEVQEIMSEVLAKRSR